MKLRAFAVDFDGTITEDGGVVNLEAVFALRWLEKLGYHVIIVSGRTPLEAYALAIYLGLTRVVVGENGGVVAVLPTKMAILGDKAKCVEAYDFLCNNIPTISLKQAFPRFTDVLLERNFELEVGRRLLEESGLPVEIIDSKYAYHINLAGINKATGLDLALRYLSISPENVVAIGDSETDIPAFKICGYSIALGNSPEETKKTASHVTDRGMGDGLVEAVNHVADKFFKVNLNELEEI
jgi:phosphoglycolate phosphatase (TIGR01487 family)